MNGNRGSKHFFTSTGLSLIVQSMFDLKAAIKVNDYLKLMVAYSFN
jgi:hypothetical protein